ncbi:MAG TPA: cytochrome bc complex cytochrome b subunit [Jiangellaceae bacterium]
MTTAPDTNMTPHSSWAFRQAERVVDLVERRVTGSSWFRRGRRTAVPNHWSFWLGYLALFSLVIVVLSGVFLTVWFEPSMAPVIYDGAYAPLRGVVVSEAYASTLDLSFEVRGGLLMRQVHYWATHVFIAAMAVHLLRVLFTGAFRTPRKLNWVVGVGLLVLGIAGAYAGHALPDDLLSGTGLRVVEGGVLAIPIVGTYLSSFIFGGAYPGDDIVTRLYVLHVFLIPALLVTLLALHVVLVRRHGRTQWRGAGKTNRNVVGSPRTVHTGRAAGLMLIVFGAVVTMAATLQINPVWLYGPYDPSQVGAGSRPDWYMAFLDGALRLMPPWEIDVLGHHLTLSLLIPVVVLPGLLVAAMALYPWVEEKIVGGRGDQHLLDRPRDMPARTGLGAAFVAFYVVLWIAGGNDVLATTFHVPVNWMTRLLQVSVVVVPPLAYTITKRICLGLQRRDRDKLLHGRETGINVVDIGGGFAELRVPLNRYDAYELTSRERRVPFVRDPEVDENGIPAPRLRSTRLRARLSNFYFGDRLDDDDR